MKGKKAKRFKDRVQEHTQPKRLLSDTERNKATLDGLAEEPLSPERRCRAVIVLRDQFRVSSAVPADWPRLDSGSSTAGSVSLRGAMGAGVSITSDYRGSGERRASSDPYCSVAYAPTCRRSTSSSARREMAVGGVPEWARRNQPGLPSNSGG